MYKSYSQIVRPESVKLVDSNEDGSKSSFVIEPLQKGFGVTLGNSLRRILLSSVRGTVVSVIEIEGVEHEFSTIPFIKQDVAKICLNLKKIVFKSELEECEGILEIDSPKLVTAGMIKTPEGVEVVNKDLPLFDIESGGKIKMKMKIKSGVGYDFKESENFGQSMGSINLDCHFSPIKSVGFSVDNTRVDKYTDYDSLSMQIETNGAITANDSLGIAAGILRDILEIFVNFDSSHVIVGEESRSGVRDDQYNMDLLRKVDDLELSVRATNCFSSANIKYIGDLVSKTEAEMLKMNNFGRKSLEEIRACLSKMGLSFGMDINEWPPKNIKELLSNTKKNFND